MEMEIQVTNLVKALEEATLMAKQLPSTDSANIYTSLHAANRHLSLFLAPQPSADNNINNNIDDDDEPMRIADEEKQAVDGEDSKMMTVETMEERMKDFSIQNNKRLKRSLSSTSLAGGERMRWLDYGIESARAQFDYDPHVT